MLGVDAMKGFSKWKEESSSHNINNNMLLIGMSANASTEDQNEAFEAGMHFFASKPVDVKVLSLLVENNKKSNSDLSDQIKNLCAIVCTDNKSNDVYGNGKLPLRYRDNYFASDTPIDSYEDDDDNVTEGNKPSIVSPLKSLKHGSSRVLSELAAPALDNCRKYQSSDIESRHSPRPNGWITSLYRFFVSRHKPSKVFI